MYVCMYICIYIYIYIHHYAIVGHDLVYYEGAERWRASAGLGQAQVRL